MILTPDKLPIAEQFAVAFFEAATNGEHGRDELDPVYRIITENRDGPTPALRAKYSSCADLGHCWLRTLGIRATWLNRDDDHDGRAWKSGVNLNYLCAPPIGRCSIATKLLYGFPSPGDVFVETNAHGGHVFCAIAYDQGTDTLTTAEYGQPGGRQKKRVGFVRGFNARALGHIKLIEALKHCTEPVDTSMVQDWATGELLDALA